MAKRKPGERKTKPRMGRPTVLTDKDKKKILEVLGDGGSRNLAARIVGCAPSTVGAEAARDADFSNALKGAEAGCELFHLKRIKVGDRGWQSAAWFLERKWPDRYGRREPAAPQPGSEVILTRSAERRLAPPKPAAATPPRPSPPAHAEAGPDADD